jgi:hypothetical protein
VKPGKKTRDVAAMRTGFGSDFSYRQAKTVVEKGTLELVAKMDAGEISVSKAAEGSLRVVIRRGETTPARPVSVRSAAPVTLMQV